MSSGEQRLVRPAATWCPTTCVPWSISDIGFDDRGAAVRDDWLKIVRGQLPDWLYRGSEPVVTSHADGCFHSDCFGGKPSRVGRDWPPSLRQRTLTELLRLFDRWHEGGPTPANAGGPRRRGGRAATLASPSARRRAALALQVASSPASRGGWVLASSLRHFLVVFVRLDDEAARVSRVRRPAAGSWRGGLAIALRRRSARRLRDGRRGSRRGSATRRRRRRLGRAVGRGPR
jgi:hypothetical protein